MTDFLYLSVFTSCVEGLVWILLYQFLSSPINFSNLQRNIQMNISKGKQKAMLELLHDHEVVIRLADKGDSCGGQR